MRALIRGCGILLDYGCIASHRHRSVRGFAGLRDRCRVRKQRAICPVSVRARAGRAGLRTIVSPGVCRVTASGSRTAKAGICIGHVDRRRPDHGCRVTEHI